MKRSRLCLLAAPLVLGSISASFGQEVRIDFGSSQYKTSNSTGKYWNNVTSPWATSSTTKLVNYSTGAALPWAINVSNSFEGVYTNGTTSATAEAGSLFGNSASRDSFMTLGQLDKGEITIRGLDPGKAYDFKLFGSVMTSRTVNTNYSIKGANLVQGNLNVGNNRSGILTLPSVKPTSTGVIRLTVDTASNNNSLFKQAFLNGLTMKAVNPPAPPPPPPPPPPAEVARNLLFFGNSFTQINNMPDLLAEIAVADAHKRPYIVSETGDSRSLSNQITEINADPASNINNIAAGQKWTNVIMQEFSTGPTRLPSGDIAQFKADTKTIYNAVKANHPNVKPVLFQTWAYHASDPYVYGPESYQFANPAAMQADLTANYAAAASELNALAGSAITSVSPVGQYWGKLDFAADLYGGYDAKHPGPRGSLIAALSLYKTIYNENVSDIAWSKLEAYLTARQITQSDWTHLTALVDSGITLNGAGFARLVVPEPASLSVLMLGASMLRRRR